MAILPLLMLPELPAQEDSASDAVIDCQQALQFRKVANGEFPEDVLVQAIRLPAEGRVSGDEAQAVSRLFGQLGADKFEEREAATVELMEKHMAPSNLRALLKKTKDPEVAGRARKILAKWKEKDPSSDYNYKFKMWINCPSSIAKLKTFPDVNSQAQKNNKHQAMYDACRSLDLGDFPQADRTRAVVYWLDEMLAKNQSMSSLFFRQLKKDEWNDETLQSAIARALQNEGNAFYGNDFEELVFNVPEDIDLKEVRPLLPVAGKRKGAIAALLVKTGDRQALPAFIELLNQEWTSLSGIEKGKVQGGGHDMYFCPFPYFEIMKQPAFKKFAPEILKGIEGKFADDRIAIHDAYLKLVGFLADTDPGMELLVKLSMHKCPQTALAACLIIHARDGKDAVLENLLAAMEAASPQDVMNNHAEFADLIRRLRGKMMLGQEKSEYYRNFIREAASAAMGKVIAAAPDYSQKNALEFYIDELVPFGLVSPDRGKLIGMLAAYDKFEWWAYPETAVRFLVHDAMSKGDLKELTDQLVALASVPGATLGELSLFADFAMISGQLTALEKMKDGLKKLLAIHEDKKTCPSQIIKAAWMLDPDMLLNSPQTFEWGPNFLLLYRKDYDYVKIASKIDSQPNPWKGNFFRLSYGLEGGDLAALSENKEYEFFQVLSEMAWKNPPSEEIMRGKLVELSGKLMNAEYSWQTSEFLRNIPELIGKFKIRTGGADKVNPILLLADAEISFRNGDAAAYRDKVDRALKEPGLNMSEQLRNDIARHEMVLDLLSGVIGDDARKRSSSARRSEVFADMHKYVSILYENGFTELARELRRLARELDVYNKWDYSECCLCWAWNEAIAGNRDEAVGLVETALFNARSRQACDYAVMLHKWLKDDSVEFREFLKVLAMKNDFTGRGDYALALAKFAEKAADKDMKALSAFMAGRIEAALKKDVGGIWKIGAEAGGMHSGYCREFLSAVPEKEEKFIVSSSWYSRDSAHGEMTPFTNSFGICYKSDKSCLPVKSTEWIGPYGIMSSFEELQYFCDGSGWWISIREQAKAWVPGEWSVFIRYDDVVEYHQHSLLPYTRCTRK